MSSASPPHHVQANARASTNAGAEVQNSVPLAASLAQLTEEQLADALRGMSDEGLRGLYALVGLHDCRCPIVKLDCGCQGPCDCPTLIEPCPHARRKPLFDWPLAVAGEVLERLHPALYAEPPLPELPSRLLRHRALVELRAERRAGGRGLWHPADFITASRSPVVQQLMEHTTRQVERRRNGTDVVRQLSVSSWQATTPPTAEPPPPAWTGPVLCGFTSVHQARLNDAGQKPVHDYDLRAARADAQRAQQHAEHAPGAA